MQALKKRGLAKIIGEGGMWVEADTNISGGESLVRQFLHGMRFFREEPCAGMCRLSESKMCRESLSCLSI